MVGVTISSSHMAACKVPADAPPRVSCVPVNKGCICVLHHGTSSSVARGNRSNTRLGGERERERERSTALLSELQICVVKVSEGTDMS